MLELIGPMLVYAGDSVIYRLTVTDDNDQRVDLTSAIAIELQVKPGVGSPDPATIAKSLGSGITLLDQGQAATRGQADISISSSETAAPVPGLYWLDVVVAISGGRTHVVAPREFTIADVVNGL